MVNECSVKNSDSRHFTTKLGEISLYVFIDPLGLDSGFLPKDNKVSYIKLNKLSVK
jgi:hypothetical protein